MVYLGDCLVGQSRYPYWKGSRGFPLGNDRPRRHILPFLHKKIVNIFFLKLERHLLMEQVHTSSRRQPCVHKWPIWVIVGAELSGHRLLEGLLGVSRSGNDRPSRHILPFLHRKIMDIFFELERHFLMEQCTPPLGDIQVCLSGRSG